MYLGPGLLSFTLGHTVRFLTCLPVLPWPAGESALTPPISKSTSQPSPEPGRELRVDTKVFPWAQLIETFPLAPTHLLNSEPRISVLVWKVFALDPAKPPQTESQSFV